LAPSAIAAVKNTEALSSSGVVSAARKAQFLKEGFFVLESVVPENHLQMMREECTRFVAEFDAAFDANGGRRDGINAKGRYFIAKRYRDSRLGEFIFSDLMADICRATLGDNACLFYEQFVVKGPEKGGKFSWHQDSGYLHPIPHDPYVTCWVTLDDVSEANGTVYLLPYSRAGGSGLEPHVVNAETNDKEGYFGSDPGDPVIVPAGSIAVFSSLVFHRSGANTTPNWRRVYLPQYSAAPLRKPDGSLIHFADPIWENGKRRYGV
jgi:ectoine hydroxylase-related dioxygenase (phytanoyl-CoA dioxygenase family)